MLLPTGHNGDQELHGTSISVAMVNIRLKTKVSTIVCVYARHCVVPYHNMSLR